MVISFLQRRCHPVTWCIEKIADQPWYNVIFYLRRTEHKYLKTGTPCVYHLLRSINRSLRTQILKNGMPCGYHLLRSIARLLLLRLQISRTCFITKKKIFFSNCSNTECKFFILLTM